MLSRQLREMMPPRPKRPARVDKLVWQEANSQCGFCPERDVSALQVHHIDSDRTNNAVENLILVCASCHTKITAGVISTADVMWKKRQLFFALQTAQAAKAPRISGAVVNRTINTGTINQTVNNFGKGRTPRIHYPSDTIGSDALRKNYVDYLLKRYYDFRKADSSYGSRRSFSHAEIHTSIQSRFGAKTFFVLLSRFDELTSYLQERIDRTIQGKANRSRGVSRYKTFSAYIADQRSS